jgi:hypothetical protein
VTRERTNDRLSTDVNVKKITRPEMDTGGWREG